VRARSGPGGPGAVEPAGALVDRLAGLSARERDAELSATVRGLAAEVVGYPGAGAVPSYRPFIELGFDSLTAIEFRNRLSLATGLRLPATLTFDFPTPDDLVDHLRSQLSGGAADDDPALRALTELDRLAVAVAGLPPDERPRQRLAAGLRDLLAELTGARPAAGDLTGCDPGSGADSGASGADLAPVSDAELAALLNDELGIA
jgi:acyl carrier protein